MPFLEAVSQSPRPCVTQLGTVAVVFGGHREDSLKDNTPAWCSKRPGHFHVHRENKSEEWHLTNLMPYQNSLLTAAATCRAHSPPLSAMSPPSLHTPSFRFQGAPHSLRRPSKSSPSLALDSPVKNHAPPTRLEGSDPLWTPQ